MPDPVRYTPDEVARRLWWTERAERKIHEGIQLLGGLDLLLTGTPHEGTGAMAMQCLVDCSTTWSGATGA